jgi:hypothetical protein
VKLTLLKSFTGILSVVSSTGCDSVRSIAWGAKWPSFWGTLDLELVTNWSILNRYSIQKKFGTVNAYDNCYMEIIVKLGQKNSRTYGYIAISKDTVILSIVMRRFYYTANHCRNFLGILTLFDDRPHSKPHFIYFLLNGIRRPQKRLCGWGIDCDGCDPGIPQSHVQQRELLTH